MDSSHTNDRTFGLRERVFDEARRFLVMFLYLWVLFGLFVLNERIILDQRGIGFASHGFALLNALVLAKVMLVTEDLNLGRWIRRRPLIYPILFESSLLTVMFICFHVVERLIVGLLKREALEASIPTIGGGGLVGVVCVGVILFAALIPFFAFRNVSRELGPAQLNAMLFGTATKVTADRKNRNHRPEHGPSAFQMGSPRSANNAVSDNTRGNANSPPSGNSIRKPAELKRKKS